uniref:Uncharacterized protein n=1 Tax=Arundo donax TaxID=35708 RepID=A0A0A8Z320_ARUDO
MNNIKKNTPRCSPRTQRLLGCLYGSLSSLLERNQIACKQKNHLSVKDVYSMDMICFMPESTTWMNVDFYDSKPDGDRLDPLVPT